MKKIIQSFTNVQRVYAAISLREKEALMIVLAIIFGILTFICYYQDWIISMIICLFLTAISCSGWEVYGRAAMKAENKQPPKWLVTLFSWYDQELTP